MTFLDTAHKRKSATITTVIMLLLLLCIFFFGMTYLDPPEEQGIAVNFGNTNVGSGNVQASIPKVTPKPVEEVKEVEQTSSASTPDVSENVLTQETEEAIAIKKAQEAERRAKAEAERKERERKAEEERKRKEEEEKRKKAEQMAGVFNNSNQTEGEGPGDGDGNKGELHGDYSALSYTGNGSGIAGDGMGYGLRNRSRKSNSKKVQDCDEEGRVVVRIVVNQSGRVVDAKYVAKGSTNSDPCLVNPALETAKTFRWNADANAPTQQVGFVVINFRVGG